MIAQRYKDMLSGKSVIRQISEWSTARGTEIGYENVFDYSLGNPSVPCPEHFTKTCIDLLQTKEPVTLHGYSPTLTIPAVRKAVAESLNRRFGMVYGIPYLSPSFLPAEKPFYFLCVYSISKLYAIIAVISTRNFFIPNETQ